MNFELPTAEAFVELRLLAGMSARNIQGVQKGLAHSNYMVTVRDGELLVGMGRIIGDGATTFQIVDVVVHPNYQGKGIGKKIMTALMKWLEAHATPQSYVSLIADGDAKFLYEKFGFKLTTPKSIGMHQLMKTT
ncbi:MAG: GNAT family N-acetyltransferase [Defluviitaleaceae bacterium]|nr:GNAT family N-acetyltransferase [Defluviitaleaceae bacterium]